MIWGAPIFGNTHVHFIIIWGYPTKIIIWGGPLFWITPPPPHYSKISPTRNFFVGVKGEVLGTFPGYVGKIIELQIILSTNLGLVWFGGNCRDSMVPAKKHHKKPYNQIEVLCLQNKRYTRGSCNKKTVIKPVEMVFRLRPGSLHTHRVLCTCKVQMHSPETHGRHKFRKSKFSEIKQIGPVPPQGSQPEGPKSQPEGPQQKSTPDLWLKVYPPGDEHIPCQPFPFGGIY